MKLLYVTQYYSANPTHASTVTTYEIVTRLAHRGHSVAVVSADSPGILRIHRRGSNSVQVVRSLPIPSLSTKWYDGFTTLFTHTLAHVPLIAATLLFYQKHTKERFDAIISMYHPTHLATVSASLLSRILKLPLVVKIFDFIIETIEPNRLKRMYHLALGRVNVDMLRRSGSPILVQSPELRDVIVGEGGVSNERLIVFSNGVDVDLFRPDIPCNELRESLKLEGKNVVLFLGGLYRQRHPELLIKALPAILREVKDVVVLFVGTGPERLGLMALAERLSVNDAVNFLEPVEHSFVPKLISLADVTVGPLSVTCLPTIYGSTPLTVLEYMACGKPVIVSRGAVSESVIINGHTGIQIEPGDVRGLSLSIIELIENQGASQTLGRNARSHVQKVSSWNVLISRLEEILCSVTKGSK
ncbi:MAG: glycosyltransferase family 4 protein [Candidatus Bathyarchaeota archaeon]|nr:MAG: glycosyltransferase family 4 protein [Candidatus Bathyarchaeota archaeon]